MKQAFAVALAVLAASVAGQAAAQAPQFYIGASVGQTRGTNVSESEVNDFLRSVGFSNPSTVADRKDTGFRLNAGWQINPGLALEAIYSKLGEYSTRSTVTGGTVNANYKADGFGLDLVVSAPFSPELSVFGRLGAFRSNVDANFTSTGVVGLSFGSGSHSRTGEHFGAGLQYEFSKQLALRLEAERHRKLGGDSTGGDLHVDLYSIGAIFRF